MSGKNRLSRRPYLLRAMHEWMTDNGETPQLVVDTTVEGVKVPGQYVQDGKIVLNVSYAATGNLVLGNELIEFMARFSGAELAVSVPVPAVLGIYARETGEGMIFTDDLGDIPNGDNEGPEPPPKGPHLKVVK